jgi:hypothetical protein
VSLTLQTECDIDDVKATRAKKALVKVVIEYGYIDGSAVSKETFRFRKAEKGRYDHKIVSDA